MHHSELR